MTGRDALLAAIGCIATAVTAPSLVGDRRLRRRLGPPTAVAPSGQVRWTDLRRRPTLLGARRAAKDQRTVERDLPRLAEAVARELRVGASPAAALFAAGEVLAGPVRTDLEAVRRTVGTGRRLESALGDWADRRPTPGVGHLVTVLALGIELGGSLAPVLDATAEALRARLEVGDEVRSLTAQARASAVLLTALPLVTVAGLAMVDPSTVGFLVGSTPGRVCLGLGGGLATAGWCWMRRLTAAGR